jgi:hypothetical protein
VVDAGHRELAARIEMVADYRLAVVVADAAAVYPVCIDPTFSDANWVSFGGLPGAAGEAIAVVLDKADNLCVGGTFTTIGKVMANYVAKWNGSDWSPLGKGMNDRVYALAVWLRPSARVAAR